MIKNLVTVAFLSFITLAGLAQVQMIKDINTLLSPTSSNPTEMITFNGKVYFSATDKRGTELWNSSGGGASIVKDIYPNSNSSNPAKFTIVNNSLFFIATDSAYGTELWRTDGTAAGTYMIKDIYAGTGSGFLNNSYDGVVINGKLYFRASDGVSYSGVWVSDGTEAGTVKLYSFFGCCQPLYFKSLNGLLIYDEDNQLFVSDGINSATLLYTPPSGIMTDFTVNGPYLFFNAQYGSDGYELMKTDGTVVGTVLVKDINPGSSSSSVGNMTSVNGTLYFSANDGINGSELWTSDGTDAGTYMIKEIAPGYYNATFPYNSVPAYFTAAGAYTYFSAYTSGEGKELWRTDGTEAGTVLVKDINTGTGSSQPKNFSNVNGKLYFQAFDSLHGIELWSTDPTVLDATLVKDIYPGSTASNPQGLVKLGVKVYFSATTLENGIEFWKSDGTDAGTLLVKDINAPTKSSCASGPGTFAVSNGNYFFVADNGIKGYELWKSDGTASGTKLVKELYPGNPQNGNSYRPQYLTNVNGTLFFSGNDSVHGYNLWKSDGTSAGTKRLKDVAPWTGNYYTYRFTTKGNVVYFSGSDSTYGAELWKSNGTSGGTKRVKDINPGTASSQVNYLCNLNGTLYFGATTDNEGEELWKSDGTEAGTQLVKDIDGTHAYSNIFAIASLGNYVYFCYESDTFPSLSGIYKTDGTANGTTLISNVKPYFSFIASNGYLYFQGLSTAAGYELWRTDGITTGLFYDLKPGTPSSNPTVLADLNGILLFNVQGNLSDEMYRTDGTIGGTYKLKDIYEGSIGSDPANVTIIDSLAIFSAKSNIYAREAFRTNGTTAGTYCVGETVLGLSAQTLGGPRDFAKVGNLILFKADDLTHGMEPWKLSTPFKLSDEPACIDTSLSLNALAAPNPFSDATRLLIFNNEEQSEKVIITISDLLGNVLLRQEYYNGSSIEVGRGLSPGVYLAQIRQGDNVRILKVVKAE